MLGQDFAECCIVKDAGDDPDVTHGAKVCARVRKIESGVALKGGVGIGTVTKKGLQVAIREPAINPVPRQMIIEEVKKILPPDTGVEIEIFVPEGEKLARKTMNPKLGIAGGISILGTTGIVEPMSEEAFKASLVPQIDVALANGFDEIVLTPGNIGEKNAITRGLPEDAIVQIGNFVGFMLEKCLERGVNKALLYGHAGKLCKVAAGVFHTHSKLADARLETIAAHAALSGAEKELIKKIMQANTVEEAIGILKEEDMLRVFDSIAAKASERSMERADNKIAIGTILISLDGKVVGSDKNARASKWAKYLL